MWLKACTLAGLFFQTAPPTQNSIWLLYFYKIMKNDIDVEWIYFGAFRGWNVGHMKEIMHRWRQEEVKQEKR